MLRSVMRYEEWVEVGLWLAVPELEEKRTRLRLSSEGVGRRAR